ncbi:MAG: T9SS type A sorting domain-containing protein [Bacteroidetes bacterium]|nr:T9SS type A sorting domain-containing protein [Bacteroidota bacterium]
MKLFHRYLAVFTFMLLMYSSQIFAQGWGGGGWNHQDTLTSVTVTGTAIIDSTMMYPMYYLDEDGDGLADYHLNFGPYWYQPDSSNAVKPNHGDVITILGGQENNNYMNFTTIIVYEINGEFWRDPIIPFWNNMGGHSHAGGHHQGNCNGFAYGWNNDTLVDTTLSGTALVDTTFFMNHYYLDTDNDQQPDYSLNFGPPWYEPASGAARPNNGETISIAGKQFSSYTFPMVIVYEINGLEWRDSSSIGDQFGGGWFHKNMSAGRKIYSPFDMQDWMQINPGWNTWGGMGGMGGMMMYDSLFGQMLEVFPQNIPFADNENLFAGYEIGVFSPNGNNGMWGGNNGMWGNGGCGGMMNFGSNINYQLHYNDIQVQGYGIDENSIQVKYWSDQTNSWEQINNAVLDKTNNTINFPISSASNFVILTADQTQVTGVEENSNSIVNDFRLEQNYPNPFNPSTQIEFVLNNSSNVKLNIYNALGQLITTLINSNLEAGAHSVKFDATGLSSGIYFYQLQADGVNLVKKMNLMK